MPEHGGALKGDRLCISAYISFPLPFSPAMVTLGTSLRMPLSEALGDGIFELRAKVGTNITRVMYFFVVGNRAVLTHGFIKKTQKTPVRELQRAKDIRDDYLERVKD